jgi:hypothetical protein
LAPTVMSSISEVTADQLSYARALMHVMQNDKENNPAIDG